MIISNNVIGKMDIPQDAIIRINIAWLSDKEEAKKLISNSVNEIYLDYPDGRKKPPLSIITLKEAIELSRNKKVKYFAISNAEDIDKIEMIKDMINCELVPKIETIKGVEIIDKMIEIGIKTIMLDKDDLWIDTKCNMKIFKEQLIKVREYKKIIKIFELAGVIFI